MEDRSHFRGELGRGVYNARRAAALAGVPLRTLNHWASTGLYVPSISPEPRPRLWSWLDLLALRTIDWLRSRKAAGEPRRVNMQHLRRAFEEMDRYGIPRERLGDFLVVSHGGKVCLEVSGITIVAGTGGQSLSREVLEVVKPYNWAPDLTMPRPGLRIIPGKLLGEPHLANTRIPSATIFSLHQSGYPLQQIQAMYPEAGAEAILEAIDLEQSLLKRAA